jgi:hypothetical protein
MPFTRTSTLLCPSSSVSKKPAAVLTYRQPSTYAHASCLPCIRRQSCHTCGLWILCIYVGVATSPGLSRTTGILGGDYR